MKQITVLESAEEQRIPCQLGKLSFRHCTLMCAFENDCPVFNIDSHDMPLVRKFHKDPDG